VARNSTLKLPEGSNLTTPSLSEACHDASSHSGTGKGVRTYRPKIEADDIASEEGEEDSDETEPDEEQEEEEANVAAPAPQAGSDDDEHAMFAGRMAVVKPLKALAPIKECVYCERDTYISNRV
jgi:hypothetical protein